MPYSPGWSNVVSFRWIKTSHERQRCMKGKEDPKWTYEWVKTSLDSSRFRIIPERLTVTVFDSCVCSGRNCDRYLLNNNNISLHHCWMKSNTCFLLILGFWFQILLNLDLKTRLLSSFETNYNSFFNSQLIVMHELFKRQYFMPNPDFKVRIEASDRKQNANMTCLTTSKMLISLILYWVFELLQIK